MEQKTLAKERQKLAALLARLEGNPPPSSHELHEIWAGRARPFWRVQPRLYTALTRKCREVGENFLAIEVAEEGLAWSNEDVDPAGHLQLVHGRALAYASVGASDQARQLIEELGPHRHASADALGLLARTHKDWFEATDDPTLRREHLLHARNAYRQALAQVSDPYLAINAATTSLLLASHDGPEAEEDRLEARQMAGRARKLCGDGEEPDAPPGLERDRATYWRLATLAECSLILGEHDTARDQYRAAGEAGRYQRAELLATRRQTRLLLHALERDPHEFDACFPLPSVGLFAGHMVDLPDRATPRFPESSVPEARARIAAVLEEHHILIGYGSAACGADLIFLRAVLDRPGGEIHVVLPFERERFKRESVMRVPAHAHWGEEFDRVLAKAASITELSDSPCWFDGNAFAFGNRVFHGMAEHKAREQGDVPVGFALWDGEPAGERIGGTADCVRQWAARGRTRVLLSPVGDEIRLEEECVQDDFGTSLPVQAAATGEEAAAGVSEEIAAILCGEWEQPPATAKAGERPAMEARARFFLRAAETLAPHAQWIVHRWVNGPQFRLIFRDLAAAGHAAQALRERTASLGGTLRLALHAGPVVRWRHPLMLGREEPAGIHLQKAARLATLPASGRTHVSREYTALLEALPVGVDRRRLHCVYQGTRPWVSRSGGKRCSCWRNEPHGEIHLSRLPDPVDDACLVHVVGRHLHLHTVPGGQADEAFTHLARDMGEDEMLIREFDTEHRARKHVHNPSLDLDVFFGSSVLDGHGK